MITHHYESNPEFAGRSINGQPCMPYAAVFIAMLVSLGCASTGGNAHKPLNTNTNIVKPALKHEQSIALRNTPQLLAGDRTVIGIVETIQSEQIKVAYQDSLQPRYLPLSVAIAKGMEFQPGDPIKMVFNEQHVLVDFHHLGHKDGHHSIIAGVVVEQMESGQKRVEIRAEDGETKTYPLRPLIRSKMAAVPIGAPAVFLIDETDHIVDVTFGDVSALEQVKGEYRQMSSAK